MRAFLQSAQVLIEEHPEEEYEIVRMDIERFRIISEMFGIDEGDKLLKFIAVKIQDIWMKKTKWHIAGLHQMCLPCVFRFIVILWIL